MDISSVTWSWAPNSQHLEAPCIPNKWNFLVKWSNEILWDNRRNIQISKSFFDSCHNVNNPELPPEYSWARTQCTSIHSPNLRLLNQEVHSPLGKKRGHSDMDISSVTWSWADNIRIFDRPWVADFYKNYNTKSSWYFFHHIAHIYKVVSRFGRLKSTSLISWQNSNTHTCWFQRRCFFVPCADARRKRKKKQKNTYVWCSSDLFHVCFFFFGWWNTWSFGSFFF